MSNIIDAPDGKSYILKELSPKDVEEKYIHPCELCAFSPIVKVPCTLSCHREARKAGLNGDDCYFEEVTK